MNTALERTERIKDIFLAAQLFYATHDNMPAVIEHLENTKPEFRSIAFESISMAIAIKDFAAKTFPAGWLAFANGAALPHKAQVYVGLGWAIAKSELPFLEMLNALDARMYFRIADGCGYYDGSFRRRKTVLSQQFPAYLPAAAMPMYDQGIGRSIWYTAKTDIHQIRTMIATFPADRQAGLWRGIGIAAAYVGGCDENELRMLWEFAGINAYQLAVGAALAARSRRAADTVTTGTESCSRLWYTLAAGDPELFPENGKEIADGNLEDRYINWIHEIEERLANSYAGASGK